MSARDRAVSIINAVFAVPAPVLLGNARTRPVSNARWAAFTILRGKGFSHAEIGAMFGLDHSSVRHGINVLASQIPGDSDLARKVTKAAEMMADIPGPKPRAWRPWTANDQALCVEMFQAGKSLTEISRVLKRSIGGVHRRLKDAHYIETKPKDYTTPLDPIGSAFSDDFSKCEAKWAKLMAGRQFPSLNIPPKPMVMLEPREL